MAETDLAKIHDRLYRLETAIEDIDSDLSGHPGRDAYRNALEHLLDAARDLTGVVIEPVRG